MSTLGLDIHFYHVTPRIPSERVKNVKVFPLLLLHGWPGSIVEFQKIIPMLTTPSPDKDYVFEVIAPSLPGYGFSQAAVRPGLGPSQVKFYGKMPNNLIKWRNIYASKAERKAKKKKRLC